MKRLLSLILVSISTVAIFAGHFFESEASVKTNSNPSALPLIREEFQTKTACDTEAYLIDDDPKGTNVRAKPDKNSSIVKTLKDRDAIVVKISGSGNGWFEIASAETVGGENDKTIFRGRGWIHSSLVGMDVANAEPKLFAAPTKNSRVLKKLIPDGSEIKPIACQGKWVQARSGNLTGWLAPETQCANPLTTCS